MSGVIVGGQSRIANIIEDVFQANQLVDGSDRGDSGNERGAGEVAGVHYWGRGGIKNNS